MAGLVGCELEEAIAHRRVELPSWSVQADLGHFDDDWRWWGAMEWYAFALSA